MPLDSCTDSSLNNLSLSLVGRDPDQDTAGWDSEDIEQVTDRMDLTDRWPYQILTTTVDLATKNCTDACAYLIRIQYKLKTSSRRRSYLQCGLSDIFVVDKCAADDNIIQQFCIGTSVPFFWNQSNDFNFLQSDYDGTDDIVDLRFHRSNADIDTWFNPYGLREDYDPEKDKTEVHCGALSFFARGDDKIKIRLAQHTQVPWAVDLNPDNKKLKKDRRAHCSHADMSDDDDDGGDNKAIYTNTMGDFNISAFTRPVPGDLLDITKKGGSLGVGETESTIKYYPKLY